MDTERAGGRAKGSGRADTRDNRQQVDGPSRARLERAGPCIRTGECIGIEKKECVHGPLPLSPSLIVTIEAAVMVCWEAHRASFGRPMEKLDWPSSDYPCRQVQPFYLQGKIASQRRESTATDQPHTAEIYARRTPAACPTIYRTPQHDGRATMRRVRNINTLFLTSYATCFRSTYSASCSASHPSSPSSWPGSAKRRRTKRRVPLPLSGAAPARQLSLTPKVETSATQNLPDDLTPR